MADSGPIYARRRFPYPSQAFGAPRFASGISQPGVLPRGQQPDGATISARRRLIYTDWAGPVLAPESFPSVTFDATTGLNKWSPRWPQPYFGKQIHASLIQFQTVAPLVTPYDEKQFGWWVQNADPVRSQTLHPSVTATDHVKVFFNLEINPAMWLPVYPDRFPAKQLPPQGWNALVIVDTSSIPLIPGIDAWLPRYPNQIWVAQSHYFNDQFWTGVLAQQPGFEWIVQHPDFVRANLRTPHLPQGMVKPVATIPNVALTVDSWVVQCIDFPARGPIPNYYLQTFEFWNVIQGLVNHTGNGSFVYYRRRRR